MVHLTVCYYHVRYAFSTELTLRSYLNVKELLVRNRPYNWSLIDSNRIQTHNYLVRKQTLNHLAKLDKFLSCFVSSYLYGEFDCILLLCQATTEYRVFLNR